MLVTLRSVLLAYSNKTTLKKGFVLFQNTIRVSSLYCSNDLHRKCVVFNNSSKNIRSSMKWEKGVNIHFIQFLACHEGLEHTGAMYYGE